MPYSYNPHRHVKIWLSKDSEFFLNLENQIRLVKMRHINPQDEIYFVFDQNLLSEKAFLELQSFCRRYSVIAKDLRQDIFPNCKTKEELKLIDVYSDEISHLEEGGNLGVASDILRWLKPIYELGTYTDFDVQIDTSALPQFISVEKPLLLSLSSFVLVDDVEYVLNNNDIIAVVDNEEALASIQKIQQYIYRCCAKQTLTEVNFIEDNKRDILTRLSLLTSKELAEMMFRKNDNSQILLKLAPIIQGKTARKARQIIIDFTGDNSIFSRKTLMDFHESFAGLCVEDIMSKAAILLREIANDTQKAIQDDHEFLTVMRQTSRFVYLKNMVVNTTGPLALMAALFGSVFNKKEIIDQDIKPFSFSCYGIDGAFVGQNSFSFHEYKEAVNAKFHDKTVGKHNDLSWLEEGQNIIKEREDNIRYIQLRIPQLINDTHAAIKHHMKTIKAKQNGYFGFYQHKTKIPTIHALDGYFGFYQYIANQAQLHVLTLVLNHFDGDSFDISAFNLLLQVVFPKYITESIENSETQKLIEKLTFFAYEAKDYMLMDEHGKVKIPSQPLKLRN